MGKIAMKAVQQQVYNLNGSGEKSLAYVLRPTRYSTISSKQIAEYCAQNSMVPKAYIAGAMVALSQCITNFLLNGHHVVFPDLGTFSLTSTGIAVGDVDKAGLDQLKKLNVRFLPCSDLKALVDNVEVELDGVFDIAGETIVAEATETAAAKTQKYYRRVSTRTVTSDVDGNIDPDAGNSSSVVTPTPSAGSVTITSINNQANGGFSEVNANAVFEVKGTGLTNLTASNIVNSEGLTATYVAQSDTSATISYSGFSENDQTISIVVGGVTLFTLNARGNGSVVL